VSTTPLKAPWTSSRSSSFSSSSLVPTTGFTRDTPSEETTLAISLDEISLWFGWFLRVREEIGRLGFGGGEVHERLRSWFGGKGREMQQQLKLPLMIILFCFALLSFPPLSFFFLLSITLVLFFRVSISHWDVFVGFRCVLLTVITPKIGWSINFRVACVSV
jgi:hypothetical protein